MSSLAQFRRSSRKVEQGIWVGKDIFEPNPDGTVPEFLLGAAHKSNPKYQAAIVQWRKDNPRIYRSQSADLQGEVEKMHRHGLIYGCVYDWRNFQDDDHQPIVFELEKVRFYLTQLPDLADILLELAQNRGSYLEGAVEDIRGEQLNTTSGS